MVSHNFHIWPLLCKWTHSVQEMVAGVLLTSKLHYGTKHGQEQLVHQRLWDSDSCKRRNKRLKLRPTLWFRTVHDVEAQKFVSIDHDLWSYKRASCSLETSCLFPPTHLSYSQDVLNKTFTWRKKGPQVTKKWCVKTVKYVLDSYGGNNLDFQI